MRVFPGGTTEGLIGGLDPNLNYLFSISTSFNVNEIIYEGERTQPIPPGNALTVILLIICTFYNRYCSIIISLSVYFKAIASCVIKLMSKHITENTV